VDLENKINDNEELKMMATAQVIVVIDSVGIVSLFRTYCDGLETTGLTDLSSLSTDSTQVLST
jgi:hypothetical protein